MRTVASRRGRSEQLTIFDFTGFAPEGAVALDFLLELAVEAGIGERVRLEHMPQDASDAYSFQLGPLGDQVTPAFLLEPTRHFAGTTR